MAALTLPTLIANNQKNQYVTQLKKAYTTVQNGFKSIMANEGVNDFGDTSLFDGTSYNNATRNDKIDITIRKHFNVVKSCKHGDSSCQIDGYTGLNGSFGGSSFDSMYNFYLADGAVLMLGLTDTCQDATPAERKVACGDLSIDVNGAKLPNKSGRDLFSFRIGNNGLIYPSAGLAVFEAGGDYWQDDNAICGTLGNSDISMVDGGSSCAARIIEEGWQMNY